MRKGDTERHAQGKGGDDMNTGGPAFPVHPDTGPLLEGMRLRDYFAGQVLVGFCGNPDWGDANCRTLATEAYRIADAMLAERERGHADAGNP